MYVFPVCQTFKSILSLFEDVAKGWMADFLLYWQACCGWLVDEMETELAMWPTFFLLTDFLFWRKPTTAQTREKNWRMSAALAHSAGVCLSPYSVCLVFTLKLLSFSDFFVCLWGTFETQADLLNFLSSNLFISGWGHGSKNNSFFPSVCYIFLTWCWLYWHDRRQ